MLQAFNDNTLNKLKQPYKSKRRFANNVQSLVKKK